MYCLNIGTNDGGFVRHPEVRDGAHRIFPVLLPSDGTGQVTDRHPIRRGGTKELFTGLAKPFFCTDFQYIFLDKKSPFITFQSLFYKQYIITYYLIFLNHPRNL